MFVLGYRQRLIGDDALALFLEVEAVINIQIAVEAEALAHQSNLPQVGASEGEAVGLHSVHLARLALAVVEVVQVVRPQPERSHYANAVVAKHLVDWSVYVAADLYARIQQDYFAPQALLQHYILGGALSQRVVGVDDADAVVRLRQAV